jgi:hypothetical protein
VNKVELNDKLEHEVHRGELARKAYACWVKDYIETQSIVVFDKFKQAQFGEYVLIQSAISALNSIETAIKTDIETGELARKQLNKGE